MTKNKEHFSTKEELEAYENLSEEEKDRRAHEVMNLFLGVLKFQFEKEYADSVTLDLLKKANMIIIK
jgi:hypothetical protein